MFSPPEALVVHYRTRSPDSDGIYGSRGNLESATCAFSTLMATPKPTSRPNLLPSLENRDAGPEMKLIS
jgi:hypothetical protein